MIAHEADLGMVLGLFWGHVGAMLGPCWGHVGDIFGPGRTPKTPAVLGVRPGPKISPTWPQHGPNMAPTWPQNRSGVEKPG